MKTCSHCNQTSPVDAKFCIECGALFQANTGITFKLDYQESNAPSPRPSGSPYSNDDNLLIDAVQKFSRITVSCVEFRKLQQIAYSSPYANFTEYGPVLPNHKAFYFMGTLITCEDE